MRAPSGFTDSDSEEEDGNVVTSVSHHKGRSPSPGITTTSSNLTVPGLNGITASRQKGSPSPAQVALAEVTQQFQAILALRSQRKVADLEAQLAQADLAESQALSLLASERQGRQRALATETETALQKQRDSRDQLLANIRTQHHQQQQQAIKKAEQLEETLQQKRQQEEDRLRRAAEEEQAAAAAKKQLEEKAIKQAEERKQAAVVAKQAQEVVVRKTPLVKIAPSAAEEEQRLSQLLKAAQETVAPFVCDKAMRDRKRATDKFITLNVQQISATLDQVRAKVSALSGFIAQQPQGPLRTYSMLTLASKLISQCEVQITRLHSFAFPLGEVAVGVGVAHPEFLAILIARLNGICPLTVPKHLGYRPESDEDEYLRAVGYRITIDDEGKVEKESTDEFISRCQGYLLFYAAMTQSDVPANPLGLGSAWAYLAKTINALPATRLTAVAVESFVKVAGFKLAAVYKGQFLKLLQVLDSSFLGELSNSGDADARAVYTRIQTYLKMSGWTKQPEGRQMPQRDASSYNRA